MTEYLLDDRFWPLFVRAGDAWTAQFNNAWDGMNVHLSGQRASRELDCRAAGVILNEDTYEKATRKGVPGSAILSLFDGGKQLRAIAAVRDSSRWKFESTGEPLPFEESRRYERRMIRERFTLEEARTRR